MRTVVHAVVGKHIWHMWLLAMCNCPCRSSMSVQTSMGLYSSTYAAVMFLTTCCVEPSCMGPTVHWHATGIFEAVQNNVWEMLVRDMTGIGMPGIW